MSSDWSEWIGRGERRLDRVDRAAFGRWLATLDLVGPADGEVPQGFHWCLCTPDTPSSRLGLDGHPMRDNSLDSFMPPVPLPRRMWASSKVEFLQPLHVDDEIVRVSRIANVSEKSGSTGPLAFVDVTHETVRKGQLAIRETQTLVYRADVSADAPVTPPPPGDGRFDAGNWDHHRVITPDEALLFRFSALTFNTHRIHYDQPYAQDVERYRGLVVHGPLMATLLLAMAQDNFGSNRVTTFAFRAMSPAICGDALHLVMRRTNSEIELGTFAADGRQVTAASATMKE